ncbi:MAG: tRNA (adenosine(37)-N6)-threonylcarbamoyltransferase complex transferase subunit TsaD [Candidatus Doudnabacteria bacterium]
MKILAIETSCDETSASVVLAGKKSGVKKLSNIVSSQILIHRKTQGVVPEVAARAHISKISSVVQKALKDAKTSLKAIDYLAVTNGPGLISSLLVGCEYTKGLALALNKKVIPTNHMLGHLYSAFIGDPKIKLPSINLIVSGGHTYLILLKKKNKFKILGSTVDDAAGEAFDKVAKMLGLSYPGGPEISKLAEKAKKKKGFKDYSFPRPMINNKNFDFSFAGLKTAVLYKIRDEKLNLKDNQIKGNLAYSFQEAAVDVLVKKTMRAVEKYKAKSITLSGGVAANKLLRKKLALASRKMKKKFYVPDFSLCTDNALMIANAAAIKVQNGFKPVKYSRIKVDPQLEFR